MGFEELLPKEDGEDLVDEVEVVDKIGNNQVYDLITGRQADWQSLIYELIHSEQLDPWDIDIVVLTNRYFEKIMELEEQEEMDFYASSKVLLAASLLLRVKSEFLFNRHLKSIDEILFGKKENKGNVFEKIEIEEDDLPMLIPRTPLPRQRKVTLNELMSALNHAMNTESRRIRKEVAVKRAKKLSEVDFPKFKRIDLKDRIKQLYARILTAVKKKEMPVSKIGYLDLIGKGRDEKLASFLPLLHLSNTKKVWLEQENHLDEIWIYLYEHFLKNKDDFIEELEDDIEDPRAEIEKDVAVLFAEVERDKGIEKVSGFGGE